MCVAFEKEKKKKHKLRKKLKNTLKLELGGKAIAKQGGWETKGRQGTRKTRKRKPSLVNAKQVKRRLRNAEEENRVCENPEQCCEAARDAASILSLDSKT